MKYVGKVGLRVVPDTKEFDAAIRRREGDKHKTVFEAILDSRKAAAEKAKLGSDTKFKVIADTETSKLDAMKAKLADLEEKAKGIKMPLADSEAMDKARADVDRLTKSVEKFQGQLDRARKDTTRSLYTTALREAKTQLKQAQAALDPYLAKQAELDKQSAKVAKRIAATNSEIAKQTEYVTKLNDIQTKLNEARESGDYSRILEAEKAKVQTVVDHYNDLIEAREKLRDDRIKGYSDTFTAAKIKFEADDKEAKAEIAALQKTLKNIDSKTYKARLEAQARNAENELASLEAKLSKLTDEDQAKLKVAVEGKEKALAEIEALRDEMERIDGTEYKAKVSVDLDGLEKAKADNDKLRDMFDDDVIKAQAKFEVDDEVAKQELKDLKKELRLLDNGDYLLKVKSNLAKEEAKVERLSKKLAGLTPNTNEYEAVNKELRDALDHVEAFSSRLKQVTDKKYRVDVEARIDDLNQLRADLKTGLAAVKRDAERNKAELKIDTASIDKQLKEKRAELAKFSSEEYKVKVTADFEKATADLAKYEAQLEEASRDKSVDIEVVLKDKENAAERLRQLRDEIDTINDPKHRLNIQAQIEGLEKARGEAEKLYGAVKKDFEIKVSAETSEAKREIKDLENECKVTIQADVDDAKAKADLAWTARDRTVKMFVTVSGLDKVEKVLKGVTGGSLMARVRDSLIKLGENIDTVVLKMAAFGPALGTVAGGIVNLVPGVLNLINGLARLAPIAVNATALMGALGLAGWGTVMAFRGLGDTGVESGRAFYNQWAQVKDVLSDIKTEFQEGFFSQGAVQGLENIANDILPQLKEGFKGLSETMGQGFAGVLEQFHEDFSNNGLLLFMENTRTMMEQLNPALRNFVAGFDALALTTSHNLPAIGGWVNGVSEKFRNWATDTDRINALLADAHTQFGYLTSAAGDLFRALEHIMNVANDGNNEGLKGLSDAMESFYNWVTNPAVTKGLDHLFDGAEKGAGNFLKVIGKMPNETGAVLATLGDAVEGLGLAFGKMTEGLLTALSNPRLREGVNNLTSALQDGFTNLNWDGIGGAIGRIADAVAAAVPVIIGILNGMLPTIDGVVTAFEGILNIVAPLAPAIGALAPVVALAGGAFSIFIEGKDKLDKLRGSVDDLPGPLGKLSGSADDVATKVAGASTQASLMSRAFSLITGPVGIAIGVIIALAAAFQHAYNINEDFRNFIDTSWNDIKSSFQGAINAIKPSFDSLVDSLKTVWDSVSTLLIPVFDAFMLAAMFAARGIAAAFQLVVPVVTAVVNAIILLVSAVMDVIGNIVGGIGKLLGDKAPAWMQNFEQTTSENLERVKANFNEAADSIPDAWGNAFDTLTGHAVGSLTKLSKDAVAELATMNGMGTEEAKSFATELNKAMDDAYTNSGGKITRLSEETVAQMAQMHGLSMEQAQAFATGLNEQLYQVELASGFAERLKEGTVRSMAEMRGLAGPEADGFVADLTAKYQELYTQSGGSISTLSKDTIKALATMHGLGNEEAKGLAADVQAHMVSMSEQAGAPVQTLTDGIIAEMAETRAVSTSDMQSMVTDISTRLQELYVTSGGTVTTMSDDMIQNFANLRGLTFEQASGIVADVTSQFSAMANVNAETMGAMVLDTSTQFAQMHGLGTQEAQLFAADVQSAYVEMYTNSNGTVTALSQATIEQIAQAHGLGAAEAASLSADVQSSMVDMSSGSIDAALTMNSGVVEQANQMKSGASAATSDAAASMTSSMSDASASVVGSASSMNTGVVGEAEAMNSGVTTAASKATSGVSTQMSSMERSATGSMNNTKAALNSGFGDISNTMARQSKAAVEAAKNAFDQLPGIARNAVSQTSSSLYGAASWGNTLFGAGLMVSSGLAQGILSGRSAVVNAAASVAAAAASAANSQLDIRSPSRVFRQIGVYTTQGLAIGIGDTGAVNMMLRSMDSVTSQLIEAGAVALDGLDASLSISDIEARYIAADTSGTTDDYTYGRDGFGDRSSMTAAEAAMVARALVGFLAPDMDVALEDLATTQGANI